MKILLLAHVFPPFNASGAVRAAKCAEYLLSNGHDVRVIAAAPQPLPQTLKTSFPRERTTVTPWARVEAPLDRLRKMVGTTISPLAAHASGEPNDKRRSRAAQLVSAYRDAVSIPDGQIGWLPYAVRAGVEIGKSWQPELIYSTALPFTSHVVAARLSNKLDCPWVGEYRDLFSGNPYSDSHSWRDRLNAKIEHRVMASAAACVTVSPPLTEYIAQLVDCPCDTITNGFDPEDFEKADAQYVDFDPDKITILYTGIIYPGRRDPTPLFKALANLGERRHNFDVRFYGPQAAPVENAAQKYNVEDVVTVYPPVSYLSSLGLQKAADLLLLLLWDDPRENGVFTGKLFEYAGAERPILSIGCDDGVAAELIKKRGLGVTARDAHSVTEFLTQLLDYKLQNGALPPILRPNAAKGLTRAAQFDKLVNFLRDCGLFGSVE